MIIIVIQVVNIKTANPKFGSLPGDVYIGRTNRYYGFPASKWQNPFNLYKEEDRPKILKQYTEYLFSSGLINDICELKSAKRLGCWCKPLACHGDILKYYIELNCHPSKNIIQSQIIPDKNICNNLIEFDRNKLYIL